MKQKKLMKQKKRVQLEHTEFDSDIDSIIRDLQNRKEEYKDLYDDLVIEAEATYDGGYNHYLVGYRMETDEEKKIRLEIEEGCKARQLEYDRQQYEKLKAKFNP